ncbi:class I SAM-dependent methyltransferase [Nocardia suismassiliense]|uniref:class I SAM-dependent methyltransferase n=1 Tax=Nocardia suismassiliense TaxID=2077092 RepID=UPI00131F1FCB|nr:methyltransferase domain-containing protein [Nocardia suismassiliense]
MSAFGNRVKFALAGEILEIANPLLPGRPHEELIRHAELGSVGRVLELCAGTGYASRLLVGRHPEVRAVGVDLSSEMIAVGRRKLSRAEITNVTLVQGDIAALPYPDNSFDTVMSVFGLHEVPTAVRANAIRESARVLGPGGRIVIVDLDRPASIGLLMDAYLLALEPRHAREVCGNGLVDLLTNSGFSIDIHKPANPFRMTQTIVATVGAALDD